MKEKTGKPSGAVGFYWRKMIFFAGVFVVGFFALNTVSFFKADTEKYYPSLVVGDLKIDMSVRENGDIFVDGKKIKERVNLLKDKDEYRFPIIDNPGQYYDSATITVSLPKPVAEDTIIEILGVHGVDQQQAYVKNDSTIIYRAEGISPSAIISVIGEMPRGTVNPPLLVSFYSWLTNLKSGAWIALAIMLPLMTFILMSAFIMRQVRRQALEKPTEEIASPPMALPPALVGALYHQKVGAREIAATLIDLALRGNIYILDRERDFAFAKNKFDKRLLPYEQILLSKIFKKGMVSSKEEIDEKLNSHLYSRKVSLLTQGIYFLATSLGYFRVNPQKMHFKYQSIGILGLIGGLLGFVVSLKFFSDSPYIIFFWVGMMISSVVIIIMASMIPIRTAIGQEALSNWLSFRNYLSSPEKFPFSYTNEEIFEKYLPYAIVLECEVAWARRFSEHNFIVPDWFVSQRSGMGLQDFCLTLFPIVSYVSRSLAAIREPGFE